MSDIEFTPDFSKEIDSHFNFEGALRNPHLEAVGIEDRRDLSEKNSGIQDTEKKESGEIKDNNKIHSLFLTKKIVKKFLIDRFEKFLKLSLSAHIDVKYKKYEFSGDYPIIDLIEKLKQISESLAYDLLIILQLPVEQANRYAESIYDNISAKNGQIVFEAVAVNRYICQLQESKRKAALETEMTESSLEKKVDELLRLTGELKGKISYSVNYNQLIAQVVIAQLASGYLDEDNNYPENITSEIIVNVLRDEILKPHVNEFEKKLINDIKQRNKTIGREINRKKKN